MARDRGASAVEFALVFPVLLLILFGLIDFGRAFNTQIQLSQAAREGARLVSMSSPDAARTPTDKLLARIQAAAPTQSFTSASQVVVTYLDSSGATTASTCTTGATNAQVTVTVPFTWITGISGLSRFFGNATFPTPTQLQTKGVMQCVS